MTVEQIINALREEVTEDGHILLDRLEGELKITFWPDPVFEAAVAKFGNALYNRDGRTYQALDRRVRHALRVWDNRYGPLNQGQREYAEELLVRAIRDAEDGAHKYASVQARLGSLVNHEVVDAGFKRRRESIDVTGTLAGLSAA